MAVAASIRSSGWGLPRPRLRASGSRIASRSVPGSTTLPGSSSQQRGRLSSSSDSARVTKASRCALERAPGPCPVTDGSAWSTARR